MCTRERRTGVPSIPCADYNRASGVPLIEIVTEPDMRSGFTGAAFSFRTLKRQRCFASDISDCRMEEGSMRCDVNVSVRESWADKTLGTQAPKLKNVNSFRSVQFARSNTKASVRRSALASG